MATETLTLDEARELAIRCLAANGCDQKNAAPVADSMVAAERDHCHSHGLFRLPGYVAGIRAGVINGKARPAVHRASPGVLRVEGDHAMAPVAHEVSFGALVEAAKRHGIAFAGFQRVHHFSALWVEIEALAGEGLCSMACTSYLPCVTPAGGSTPLFGTNPFAFGWPRSDGPPLVFDMATAAMARGEIMIAGREGVTLPPGAGVGPDGEPSTDPATVLAGAQLPFGGYKGSALALMVELLAGPLIGETLSVETAEGHAGRGVAAVRRRVRAGGGSHGTGWGSLGRPGGTPRWRRSRDGQRSSPRRPPPRCSAGFTSGRSCGATGSPGSHSEPCRTLGPMADAEGGCIRYSGARGVKGD